MENPGIQPVMDVGNRGGYGYGDGCGMYGGGMWFMWIIVLFALMGGWNNRNNNNDMGVFANGAITRNEITNGFNNQDTQNALRGIQNGLCDGFYAQNTTMLNGFNGVGRDLCQGFGNVTAAIAENRFAAQQCCCDTNRNIDSVRFQSEKNTCDITTAIHAEGEKTRALIVANTVQDLRDKLADRDRDLQSANFQLSQLSQTSNLINTLRPFPQPAYPTCSPYTAANVGCGLSNGCC